MSPSSDTSEQSSATPDIRTRSPYGSSTQVRRWSRREGHGPCHSDRSCFRRRLGAFRLPDLLRRACGPLRRAHLRRRAGNDDAAGHPHAPPLPRARDLLRPRPERRRARGPDQAGEGAGRGRQPLVVASRPVQVLGGRRRAAALEHAGGHPARRRPPPHRLPPAVRRDERDGQRRGEGPRPEDDPLVDRLLRLARLLHGEHRAHGAEARPARRDRPHARRHPRYGAQPSRASSASSRRASSRSSP